MIGDRHFDIEGGKANGIVTVGVEYGFAKAGELKEAKADYVIKTVEELHGFLLRGSEDADEKRMKDLSGVFSFVRVPSFKKNSHFAIGYSAAIATVRLKITKKLLSFTAPSARRECFGRRLLGIYKLCNFYDNLALTTASSLSDRSATEHNRNIRFKAIEALTAVIAKTILS